MVASLATLHKEAEYWLYGCTRIKTELIALRILKVLSNKCNIEIHENNLVISRNFLQETGLSINS